MVNSCFRAELDSYEVTLAQWAKFSLKTCRKVVIPNGLEIKANGDLWLLHQVSDAGQAIKCRNGKAVRLLKLDISNMTEQSFH